MARASGETAIDTELAHLPPALRWREWMGRIEAVIFASPEPVGRAALARIVGRDCPIERVIEDIGRELEGRPYELVAVAGGWQHRTRPAFGEIIRASRDTHDPAGALSDLEAAVLMAVAYIQPVTRGALSAVFGREISRDLIASLRRAGMIASGPRAPRPGAPYSYVTTPLFLATFGFASLRDLPDIEMLEDAGLIDRERTGGMANVQTDHGTCEGE